jgi:hypothetical protein
MSAAYDRTTRPVNLVHLRVKRKDGVISARCVRHHKTSPMESSARDLVVTRDLAKVTCKACRIHEVTT